MADHQPQPSAALTIAVERGAPLRGTLPVAEPCAMTATTAITPPRRTPSRADSVDAVPLKRLTAGRSALKIAHAGETYLLRITKANKLILTKPATNEKITADTNV